MIPPGRGYYLLNASNGQIIDHISTPGAFLFAQPVFDNNDLIVAGRNGMGVTAFEITTPGPPITSVSPGTLSAGGSSTTITLTGSGFQTGATVFVSGTVVGGAHAASVKSSTQLTFNMTAGPTALGGPRDITVVEPGTPNVALRCAACLNIQAQTPSPLEISGISPLPVGTQGQNYDQSIGIAGGVGPYHVSITSGHLPQGLSVNQNGNLSGVITAAGTSTFSVQVTDGLPLPRPRWRRSPSR